MVCIWIFECEKKVLQAGLPQFLVDQLTLSQPGGGAHYSHQVLQAPLDFQTLRRPWQVI